MVCSPVECTDVDLAKPKFVSKPVKELKVLDPKSAQNICKCVMKCTLPYCRERPHLEADKDPHTSISIGSFCRGSFCIGYCCTSVYVRMYICTYIHITARFFITKGSVRWIPLH